MYLLLFGIFALANTAVAAGAWVFLSKVAPRPLLTRAVGALLGAAAGTLLALPELNLVFELVCDVSPRERFCDLAFAAPVLYVFPFVLPVTTGLSTWLGAEVIGGRRVKPLVTLGWTVLGSVLAAALIFPPLFFIPRAMRVLHGLILGAAWIVPAIGALVALALVQLRPWQAQERSRKAQQSGG
jgi:hypothetical protein